MPAQGHFPLSPVTALTLLSALPGIVGPEWGSRRSWGILGGNAGNETLVTLPYEWGYVTIVTLEWGAGVGVTLVTGPRSLLSHCDQCHIDIPSLARYSHARTHAHARRAVSPVTLPSSLPTL